MAPATSATHCRCLVLYLVHSDKRLQIHAVRLVQEKETLYCHVYVYLCVWWWPRRTINGIAIIVTRAYWLAKNDSQNERIPLLVRGRAPIIQRRERYGRQISSISSDKTKVEWELRKRRFHSRPYFNEGPLNAFIAQQITQRRSHLSVEHVSYENLHGWCTRPIRSLCSIHDTRYRQEHTSTRIV